MSVPEWGMPLDSSEPPYIVLVTIKGVKVLVTSDAFHGVLLCGEFYRCVFCETEPMRELIFKEFHKSTESHRKMLEKYPHVEEFQENLIRQLSGSVHYCTICNVVIASHYIYKHIKAETHTKHLNMAIGRALGFRPLP